MISNEQRAHELALQMSNIIGNFLIDSGKTQASITDKKNVNINMDQAIDAYFVAYHEALKKLENDN